MQAGFETSPLFWWWRKILRQVFRCSLLKGRGFLGMWEQVWELREVLKLTALPPLPAAEQGEL